MIEESTRFAVVEERLDNAPCACSDIGSIQGCTGHVEDCIIHSSAEVISISDGHKPERIQQKRVG
jgi:hypothetical protein